MAKHTSVELNPVGELVREAETNFISGGGSLTSKYVTTDAYEDINKIQAYIESKHTTGETDNQGREKPFFNIVIAARNVWYRATDLDRKNIHIKPTKSADVLASFLATVHLQNWMRREDFGSFLNIWGLELATFNSSVVKFIESDGKLHPMVIPWSRLIVDQIDFESNPKIEILDLTEQELRKRVRTMNYNKDIVEKLCDALVARELTDGQDKDHKENNIKLYEVHGVMPLSYITGNEKDEYTYVQQMHVLSFVASKDKGMFNDFTLYSGREEQDPYMLTCLMPKADGSISFDGSVKNLFEAQWMVNHTAKSIKDQLDVASTLLFQTADTNFVGRNVLNSIQQGDILVHAMNSPLTQLNNQSHDITAQQSFHQMWKGLGSEIAGISESMLGNAAPSGTAWRQVEALLNESHSLFELMTENKGLDVEKMLRRFVIPHLKKKMDTNEEIAATLQAHDIAKIDSIYIPSEAAKRFNDRTLETLERSIMDDEAEMPTPFNAQVEQGAVKQDLGTLGNQRFFIPDEAGEMKWSEYFKDLEWELEVDITGEQKNNQNTMATLSTVLQVVNDPNYGSNPTAQMIVGKILSHTGVVSPIELSTIQPTQQPQPVAQSNPLEALVPANAR